MRTRGRPRSLAALTWRAGDIELQDRPDDLKRSAGRERHPQWLVLALSRKALSFRPESLQSWRSDLLTELFAN